MELFRLDCDIRVPHKNDVAHRRLGKCLLKCLRSNTSFSLELKVMINIILSRTTNIPKRRASRGNCRIRIRSLPSKANAPKNATVFHIHVSRRAIGLRLDPRIQEFSQSSHNTCLTTETPPENAQPNEI